MAEYPIFDSHGLAGVLRHLTEGVAVAAARPWPLIYVNPALAEWLGRSPDSLFGQPLDNIFSHSSRAAILERAAQVWQGQSTEAAIEAFLHSDDASPNRVGARLCRLLDGDQTFLGVVLQSETSWPHSAAASAGRRDPLTELPDRDFLLSRLQSLLHGERSGDHQFAVLFIDLDNFKQVNDAHGHLVGDRLLREVARRLSECVRDGDHVVRFGGDEFVVLVERVMGREEIEPVIARIHEALGKPIAFTGVEFTPSLSIGVAAASPHHHSPEDLLHAADRDMYASKRVRR